MTVSSVLGAVVVGATQAAVGGVGSGPEPVTVNFTSAQVAAGLAGPINTTSNAARIYMRAGRTTWFGRIKGTEALLACSNDFANDTEVIAVSVDGGAYTNLNRSAGLVTLFSGLADAWHTVAWRIGSSFGDFAFILSSGDVLTVTGVDPQIDVPTNMRQVGLTGDFTAAELIAQAANYVPTNGLAQGSTTNGVNTGSLGFTGSPTKLFFVTKASYVALSVDGGAPSYYAVGTDGGVIVDCDGQSHDYLCWDSGSASLPDPNVFTVGSDAALSDLAVEKRLHHFGHSIVAGDAAPTSPAHTDMGRTSSRNGYHFNNLGVSGDTIANARARIDANLALLTVSSSDVMIIDLGRNDGATALDATAQTNLNYIIDACETKGYGTILVLGGLIDAGYNPYTGGQAGSVSSLVTAQANPNVVYVDRSAYTGISTADGVHPNDAGYVTIDGFNVTYIDPLI